MSYGLSQTQHCEKLRCLLGYLRRTEHPGNEIVLLQRSKILKAPLDAIDVAGNVVWVRRNTHFSCKTKAHYLVCLDHLPAETIGADKPPVV